METCLVDTSYLLARLLKTDPLHERAIAWQHRTDSGYRFITTETIIIEFLDSLSRASQQIRLAGIAIFHSFRINSRIEVVPMTDALFEDAVRYYSKAQDKDWGMTDCISIALMHKRKVREALTFDHHFEQAGFRALLREEP